jgi:hypothetical protein
MKKSLTTCAAATAGIRDFSDKEQTIYRCGIYHPLYHATVLLKNESKETTQL